MGGEARQLISKVTFQPFDAAPVVNHTNISLKFKIQCAFAVNSNTPL